MSGRGCAVSQAHVPLTRLRTERTVGVSKVRSLVAVSRVAPEIDIAPFNHTFDTLERAVKERVFTVKDQEGKFVSPPRPATGVFAQRMSSTLHLLSKHLPSTAPITYQQFVDSYSGRKKVNYEKALIRMRNEAWTIEEEARVSVFIKCEKTDHTTKLDPVPRVISPRSSLYNLRLGRYLKPLENRLLRKLNSLFGHKTVFKGINAETSAKFMREKWNMFVDPVAVGLDASRFDQHVSIDALKWEHEVYLRCFGNAKDKERLAKLLGFQLVNDCIGRAPDGKLKYKIAGTRMSGDMNTSLGNCVLMSCMIHAYSVSRGITLQLANNGDDCVVFMERSDLDRFSFELKEWFLEMGFNMTVEEPVSDFERIDFCQTRPVFDGCKWVMVRNPHVAIKKDSVMINPWQGTSHFLGWVDAIGVGGLALAGGIPVFNEYYQLFVRSGKKRRISEDLLPASMMYGGKGQNREYSQITPEARASFYLAYDLTPDEQICLEDHYRKMIIDGCVVVDGSVCHPRSVF